ncbi:hypothetical protein MC885_008359 [Smutsia gigantea]|nr:hypothetical protein MC885_008359 [Smutsia gigantea]
MERDLNIVVHVQHYENMDTRAPINNLRKYSCVTHCWSHPLTMQWSSFQISWLVFITPVGITSPSRLQANASSLAETQNQGARTSASKE